MAGYSGKPVVQKLGIQPGFCIFIAGAPAAYDDIVGTLPADVTIVPRLNAPLDMVHLFATERRALPQSCGAIAGHRAGWHDLGVVAEEVFRDRERPDRCRGARHRLPLGLVDIKVCAIDDTWSGLKFVIPKDQRTTGDQRIKRPK